jgi:hypothetical protein
VISLRLPKKGIAHIVWDSDGPTCFLDDDVIDWVKSTYPEILNDLIFTEIGSDVLFFFPTSDSAMLFKLRWGGQ